MDILISTLIIIFIVGVSIHTISTYKSETKFNTGSISKEKSTINTTKKDTKDSLCHENLNDNNSSKSSNTSSQKEIAPNLKNNWENLPETIDKRAQELLEEDGDW